MQIYNRKQELADWIRRRLGVPILKAVPLAPVQLDDIIDEISGSTISERGARMDDKRSEGAMEERKKAGYF